MDEKAARNPLFAPQPLNFCGFRPRNNCEKQPAITARFRCNPLNYSCASMHPAVVPLRARSVSDSPPLVAVVVPYIQYQLIMAILRKYHPLRVDSEPLGATCESPSRGPGRATGCRP